MAGFCRNCGHELQDGAEFCPDCGTQIKRIGIQPQEAVGESKMPGGFCRNCGHELQDGAEFCPDCGTQIKRIGIQPQEVVGESKMLGGFSQKECFIAIAILVVAAIIGGVFFFRSQKQETAEPEPASAAVEELPASTTEASKVEEPQKSPLASAQEELQVFGFKGSVQATTYGDNPDGYLAVLRKPSDAEGSVDYIVLVDKKNNRAAQVTPTNMRLSKYAEQRNKKVPDAMIANFVVLDDTHGADDSLGIWEGAKHRFSIFAAYKFDADGKVVPGMLTSGQGKNPSHFQEVLKEQKNVDMGNLFLVEAIPLWENAKKNNVNL